MLRTIPPNELSKFDMDSVLPMDSVAVDSILLQAVRVENRHRIIIKIFFVFINKSLPYGLTAIYIVPVTVPVGSCQAILLLSGFILPNDALLLYPSLCAHPPVFI